MRWFSRAIQSTFLIRIELRVVVKSASPCRFLDINFGRARMPPVSATKGKVACTCRWRFWKFDCCVETLWLCRHCAKRRRKNTEIFSTSGWHSESIHSRELNVWESSRSSYVEICGCIIDKDLSFTTADTHWRKIRIGTITQWTSLRTHDWLDCDLYLIMDCIVLEKLGIRNRWWTVFNYIIIVPVSCCRLIACACEEIVRTFTQIDSCICNISVSWLATQMNGSKRLLDEIECSWWCGSSSCRKVVGSKAGWVDRGSWLHIVR